MTADPRSRIDELRQKLRHHNDRYYVGTSNSCSRFWEKDPRRNEPSIAVTV
jgi:hypothetical protein